MSELRDSFINHNTTRPIIARIPDNDELMKVEYNTINTDKIMKFIMKKKYSVKVIQESIYYHISDKLYTVRR